MDKEKLKSDISSVLQEFRKLLINHEESKTQQVKLKGLIETLREELKTSRNVGRCAEIKRSKSLGFVAQQQEVIMKMLHIKEDSEQLKQTISQLETRLTEIKISSLADQNKRDAEILNTKHEYLNELLKVYEEGDVQVKKLEQEFEIEIQGLKSAIEIKKDNIDKQSDTINCLLTEIANLKDKAVEDLEAYHNKLAERDKFHQAELGTWKVAQMKLAYKQNDLNPVAQFLRIGPLHPIQNNTFSDFSGSNTMYIGGSRLPEANNYFQYQQLQNSMTQLYSGFNDCPTIQNSSIPLLPRRNVFTEPSEYLYQRCQNNLGLQTETNDFCQTQNNLVSHSPVYNDQQTTRSSTNPQMLTGSVSRLPEVSNLYKLPSQTQSYPKLPLILKNRNLKSVSRVVRPLPRPKESVKENAGFRKAGELYWQDKGDESADEPSARQESDGSTELEKCDKQKPLIPAKRRKLFHTERDSLL